MDDAREGTSITCMTDCARVLLCSPLPWVVHAGYSGCTADTDVPPEFEEGSPHFFHAAQLHFPSALLQQTVWIPFAGLAAERADALNCRGEALKTA